MSTVILDGQATAQAIQTEIAAEVSTLVALHQRKPKLSVIVIGNDPASHLYTKKKKEAAEALGMESERFMLPDTVRQTEILAIIKKLNCDPSVDGILCQLPLPSRCDTRQVCETILPSKDVDGFHPTNLGSLLAGYPNFIPCTPLGCLELLKRYKIPTAGAHAVVVGRSNIVGKPLSVLLGDKTLGNATVTQCHSQTKNLAAVCQSADILIAAIGRPHFITTDFVKTRATVIDVGINSIPDESKKSGRRIVGDVDFEAVKTKAAAITPVPGGIGPMTVAMLLTNTLRAYKIHLGLLANQ